MTDLKSLFDKPELAIEELKYIDFQEAFNDITKIRQCIFDEKSFFEIMNYMMKMGIIPKSDKGIPYKHCKFEYVYERLSQAEVRLMQVKNYIIKKKKLNNKNTKPNMFKWIM